MNDSRLRIQAKLCAPALAQYWTADEMQALHDLLAEKDALLKRKHEAGRVFLQQDADIIADLCADNERLRAELAGETEWRQKLQGDADYLRELVACRQVPDQASVPSEVVEALKVVADALPQGLNFEIYSAVLTVNDWICGQMKGEATNVDK